MTGFDPNVTTEEGLKPVPVIVRVNEGPPAVALAGINAPMVGWEFAGRTVRARADDGLPPGLETVTSGVPATAMALAGIVACISLGPW